MIKKSLFFNNSKYSDIIIKIDNIYYYCHKIILDENIFLKNLIELNNENEITLPSDCLGLLKILYDVEKYENICDICDIWNVHNKYDRNNILTLSKIHSQLFKVTDDIMYVLNIVLSCNVWNDENNIIIIFDVLDNIIASYNIDKTIIQSVVDQIIFKFLNELCSNQNIVGIKIMYKNILKNEYLLEYIL